METDLMQIDINTPVKRTQAVKFVFANSLKLSYYIYPNYDKSEIKNIPDMCSIRCIFVSCFLFLDAFKLTVEVTSEYLRLPNKRHKHKYIVLSDFSWSIQFHIVD